MIEGVQTKTLKVNMDDRGYLMEIIRNDEEFYHGFGQCYITSCFPGVVKAWHMHQEQEDNIVAIKGNIKLVLFDARTDSPTFGEIDEFFTGERRPMVVKIPPGIYHGFTSIEGETAVVLNVPTMPYNGNEPDEERLPYDTPEIGYDWSVRNR